MSVVVAAMISCILLPCMLGELGGGGEGFPVHNERRCVAPSSVVANKTCWFLF